MYLSKKEKTVLLVIAGVVIAAGIYVIVDALASSRQVLNLLLEISCGIAAIIVGIRLIQHVRNPN